MPYSPIEVGMNGAIFKGMTRHMNVIWLQTALNAY